MSSSRIALWTWLLIFGGLLGCALGWTVVAADAALGWSMVGLSVMAVLVGLVLIWVRSRMERPVGE